MEFITEEINSTEETNRVSDVEKSANQYESKMNFFKRQIFKGYLATKKNMSFLDFMPKHKLDENQILGVGIFEKALVKPGVELLMAPLSETYYIESDDIFIILNGDGLKLINGVYQYRIDLPETACRELSNKFRRALENRRKKMEKKMILKTQRSLKNILENLSDSPVEQE
jgi:hypothetical protein